ncbi:MAG: tetratricopeptide repeat protein [Ferruginibacter sp.]
MKKIIFCFSIFCFAKIAYSQPLPDSVLKKYNSSVTPKSKENYLWNYLQSLSKDNNEVPQALNILSYFKKQKDESGADNTELYIALRLGYKGDYITALNMGLSVLSNCEKRKDTIGILHSFQVIHYSFSLAKNFEESIAWQKKAIPFAAPINDESKLSTVYNDLGAVYAQALMPDSGLVYAQKAVNIDTKLKDVKALPYSLSTLGENYIAGKDYDLALPFLRKSLAYAQSNGDVWATAYSYLDFAQAYIGLKNYDSTIYYARKSVELSNYMGFKETLLKSCEALYKSFEATGREDSVNKYFRLATAAKDSIYSTEKTSNIQAISFREQLRQQEIETEKTKNEDERKQNIQFALIALGIISFIIIFLLLSRRFITNTKLIEFLGVIGLLLVFEFLNLLLHPFLERVTNHSPVLMLLALVCIAALLVPLHHKVEHWATAKLVEKNKKIRLAAAKRTIEQLDKKD